MTKTSRLLEALTNADAVVVGAGAGLSTSAGFTYSGERFQKYFADFIAAYGFTDMYSAGFYPFKTLEEQWAYWSRHIWYNRYVPAPKDTYAKLAQLLAGKDFFVLTTNVDHQFQLAGFPKERLFYTQGDYGLWQCSQPCHANTYDNYDNSIWYDTYGFRFRRRFRILQRYGYYSNIWISFLNYFNSSFNPYIIFCC